MCAPAPVTIDSEFLRDDRVAILTWNRVSGTSSLHAERLGTEPMRSFRVLPGTTVVRNMIDDAAKGCVYARQQSDDSAVASSRVCPHSRGGDEPDFDDRDSDGGSDSEPITGVSRDSDSGIDLLSSLEPAVRRAQLPPLTIGGTVSGTSMTMSNTSVTQTQSPRPVHDVASKRVVFDSDAASASPMSSARSDGGMGTPGSARGDRSPGKALVALVRASTFCR